MIEKQTNKQTETNKNVWTIKSNDESHTQMLPIRIIQIWFQFYWFSIRFLAFWKGDVRGCLESALRNLTTGTNLQK